MQTDNFETTLARFLDQSARYLELPASAAKPGRPRQGSARERLAQAWRNAGQTLPSKPAWIL